LEEREGGRRERERKEGREKGRRRENLRREFPHFLCSLREAGRLTWRTWSVRLTTIRPHYSSTTPATPVGRSTLVSTC
jgi:hypothetical protein